MFDNVVNYHLPDIATPTSDPENDHNKLKNLEIRNFGQIFTNISTQYR